MSGVALHVVGGLVEVTDPRDVILPRDADYVAGV